jgi:electron transfer flavoprotein beta subunit
MQARQKPLEVRPAVESEVITEIKYFEKPPAKGPVKLVDPDNIEELIELLQNEAKVL